MVLVRELSFKVYASLSSGAFVTVEGRWGVFFENRMGEKCMRAFQFEVTWASHIFEFSFLPGYDVYSARDGPCLRLVPFSFGVGGISSF